MFIIQAEEKSDKHWTTEIRSIIIIRKKKEKVLCDIFYASTNALLLPEFSFLYKDALPKLLKIVTLRFRK